MQNPPNPNGSNPQNKGQPNTGTPVPANPNAAARPGQNPQQRITTGIISGSAQQQQLLRAQQQAMANRAAQGTASSLLPTNTATQGNTTNPSIPPTLPSGTSQTTLLPTHIQSTPTLSTTTAVQSTPTTATTSAATPNTNAATANTAAAAPAVAKPSPLPASVLAAQIGQATPHTSSTAVNNPANKPIPRPTQQPHPVDDGEIISKQKLQELINQIAPNTRLDPEVEEILMDIADEFVESVANFSCNLAKHRKSNVLEVKDVQLHLEHNWNIKVPGFGDESKMMQRHSVPVSDAHKHRLDAIKKVQHS